MIPKTIHYCWFGKGKKGALIESCIASWKRVLPDYKIVEWNEENYPITPEKTFAYRRYAEKKWAFVSDYARLEILAERGGIYLDTDMFLYKPLDDFLANGCFLGKEDAVHVSAGIIGAVPDHPYILACKKWYDEHPDIITPIPKVLTSVYEKNPDLQAGVNIYEQKYFYPYSAETVKRFDPKNPPAGAYAAHLWNYGWGHPLNRFFKKIGIHRLGTTAAEKLGIKNILKRIFGFI
ncbi:MAG: hypothetical protein KGH93_03485 [Patescibacteria group bacterium]|nr:hypothetical protein [Patescibacteria group bacterium]MDE1946226.1 hypothetical protein [Patescibacteria group bacterium]